MSAPTMTRPQTEEPPDLNLPAVQSPAPIIKGNQAANPSLFAKYLNDPVRKRAMGAIAASFMNPERLTKIVIRSVVMTPALQKCTMDSIFRAALMAAELGLEPGSALGEAYFVPYGNQAQMIPGYRGLITLARRSGEVEDIYANCVYSDDEFDVVLGTEQKIYHKPGFGDRDPAKILYVYAVARLKGGAVHIDIMTRAEVDRIRGRSKASNNGPWVTDYAEMAKKTVIRRIVKTLPMSVELAKATALENAIDTGDYSQVDFDCIDGEIVTPPEPIENGNKNGQQDPPARGAAAVKERLKGKPDSGDTVDSAADTKPADSGDTPTTGGGGPPDLNL